MEDRNLFLDAAHAIGQRLVDHAMWENGACTWQIMTPDRDHPDKLRAIPATAPGTVYQGTAGIALFLGELFAHTHDEAVRRAAEGAICHAVRGAETLPENSFGFHSGRVGISYAAARLASRLDAPSLQQRSSSILAPLLGKEDQDRGIDVIAGAAGAIPALLQMAAQLGDERLVGSAVRLGEHLIQAAYKEPRGWSWGDATSTRPRHLCGLAHGAAGVGHALLELYHATKCDRYLYAAQQAFLYERQFFSKETSNWPDFRYSALDEYIFAESHEELKRAVRAGELPPYEETYMTAWCHGAPGIGLTRLRAYEILEEPLYFREARAAVETAEDSVQRLNNYSLCHGIGGNCETLLYAADVLESPGFRTSAEQAAKLGWERYEGYGRTWLCGTLNCVSDPSLLLGEAGIGYFFLRLYSSETPSCLLLKAPEDIGEMGGTGKEIPAGDYRGLQKAYVDTYFRRSRRVLEALGNDSLAPIEDSSVDIASAKSDVVRYLHQLQEEIAQLNGIHRQLLADATQLDRMRLEMTQGISDFSKLLLENLRRPAPEEVQWEEGRIQLSEYTRVLHGRWDWDAWLERSSQKRPLRPESCNVFFLAYRAGKSIVTRRLGPFAAVVFRSMQDAVTLEELVDTVCKALKYDGSSAREEIQGRVIELLDQAYRMNVIRREGFCAAGFSEEAA